MNYSYETEWKKYSTLIFMNYKNIVWNYFADLWCMKSKELVSMEVKDQYPIIRNPIKEAFLYLFDRESASLCAKAK